MVAELATTLTSTEAERLEQAEALVRGFCGWHIAPARTATVELRGNGRRVLPLPSMYVTAITAVDDDGTALTVDDDYIWTQAGLVTRVGYWSTGVVTVTLTHGYATPPADVVAIVRAVAQRAVDNPGSLTRKQIGPFSDTYSATGSGQVATLALLDAEKEVLRRYRIPAVA